MNRLLESVIEAHGGAKLWEEFSDLVTDVDLTGQLFQQSGWSALLPQSRLLIALRSQRTILLLPEGQGKVILEPDRMTHLNNAGALVESMPDPAARGLQIGAGFRWNTLSAAYYFISVIRRAVAAPFLYASAGFATEETGPWIENGEVWRGLKVTFPSSADFPSPVHYAYFGPDGLLRRLRHSVPFFGGIDLVDHVSSYCDVNGILMPFLRDVFACDPMGHTLGEQRLGRIELRDTFLTA